MNIVQMTFKWENMSVFKSNYCGKRIFKIEGNC